MNPFILAIALAAVVVGYLAILDAIFPAPPRVHLVVTDTDTARILILILEAELAAREAELDQLTAALQAAKN